MKNNILNYDSKIKNINKKQIILKFSTKPSSASDNSDAHLSTTFQTKTPEVFSNWCTSPETDSRLSSVDACMAVSQCCRTTLTGSTSRDPEPQESDWKTSTSTGSSESPTPTCTCTPRTSTPGPWTSESETCTSTERPRPCSRDSRFQTGPSRSAKKTALTSTCTRDRTGKTQWETSTLSGLRLRSKATESIQTLSTGSDSSRSARDSRADCSSTKCRSRRCTDTAVTSTTKKRHCTRSSTPTSSTKTSSAAASIIYPHYPW